MSDTAGHRFRCPRCHSPRVWESARGWVRVPARVVARYRLWCAGCGHRFWRFAWNPPPEAGPAEGDAAARPLPPPPPPPVGTPAAPPPPRVTARPGRGRRGGLLGRAGGWLERRLAGPARRCPACAGDRLWRSGRGWLRLPARLLLLYPLRCRDCGRRFWRVCWSPPPAAP